ncbi:bifunctional tetrahydrofolate synthase/dihydrofolate synthase [Pseudomonas typographi]|uniref:Dihydrofolate synthase/folylpolyglutamate synthase n=1 Tax=Pseudomonas typographi TaxID=2715964 RepID=A0ABR7YY80_9PSED|nr:bifunctional tetrahydrofolate synthase/dihydrofolate synthase [Pseudomonas typographi]MBD1550398.1 bifunctional tetrahydrofolate synthase/dihydrofolate synthase [Pseudomonas typographi]MBD1588857.1 bifunctional tetrahydrofolate synthase/dihydrofolate synthase [Pseudomonas typographi]MBD1598135.1 bifunctional tetrahydrofolate synthase/dihydrofolate synthase [Pseudomonas typographi]
MTARTLAQWLAYLEQLHPSAIDMGLERSRQVFERMGLGRLARYQVLVTGTNGKGSTCAFLASLLEAQGLKVGVYSSPHLLRYNERVRLAGLEASDAALCEAFTAVEAARGEVSLTYFEMGTLAAFWLFARAGLDAVVLEVGLGGRLDAVNLADADLALVTSIALDHGEYLGHSREAVAFEKAGIFRAGRPVLCGDLAPPLPLLQQAQALGCPLSLRGHDYDLAPAGDHWQWRGHDRQGVALTLPALPLLELPMENAALALQAYALLGLPFEPGTLAGALQGTRLAGRLDRRELAWQGKVLHLLLDVGHNPEAAQYLSVRLAARPVAGRRFAVFGLLADKDLAGVVAPLAGTFSQWAVATLPSPRSREATQVARALANLGVSAASHGSVAQALEQVCNAAGSEDEIVVFGSFFCVAEALRWLAGRAA